MTSAALPEFLSPAQRAALADAQRLQTQLPGAQTVWHAWGLARPATVVLLHGGSGSWTHWVRNIAALSDAGWCVLVPDLPGFGDSDLPEGCSDVDALPAHLHAGLQQLQSREVMQNAASVQLFLQLHMAHKQHEVFAMMFLDAQHKLLCMETLFRGTLSQTSVYPREVVLRALHHHSAAVVLAHNHPSGSVHPSPADIHLTHTLKSALAMVDVRVLDHVIVGPGQAFSMAEQGVL